MTTHHRVAIVTILIVIGWLLALPFRHKAPAPQETTLPGMAADKDSMFARSNRHEEIYPVLSTDLFGARVSSHTTPESTSTTKSVSERCGELTARLSAPVIESGSDTATTESPLDSAGSRLPGFLRSLSPWGGKSASAGAVAWAETAGSTTNVGESMSRPAGKASPSAFTKLNDDASPYGQPLTRASAFTIPGAPNSSTFVPGVPPGDVGSTDFLAADDPGADADAGNASLPGERLAAAMPNVGALDFESDQRFPTRISHVSTSRLPQVGDTAAQPLGTADFDARPRPSPKPRYHRIVNGDNLATLAQRYYGDARLSLMIFNLNRDVLSTPEVLPLGVEIRIPLRESL